MSLTEMTFDDRVRLSQLRHERLRRFFAQTLLHCVFRRDHHKTLIIHCPEAWIVDRLLTDAEELCDYAWLILGVEAIALYFAHEEICRVRHCNVHHASSGLRPSILKQSGYRQHACSNRFFHLKSPQVSIWCSQTNSR